MATFTIPAFSDDDDDVVSTKTDSKQSLFERRKEFAHLSSQSSVVVKKTLRPGYNPEPQTELLIAPSDKCNPTENKQETQEGESTVQAPTSNTDKSENQELPSTEFSSSAATAYRIRVNKKQKGNPILKFIRNVPWELDAIVPDYELGRCTCALYLSIKYHNRFPEYIHSRLKELGKSYELRILLVQVDTKQQDISHELNQLAQICILADCTMILAFSFEEAGRYLEVYKAYENKPPTDIMGKTKTDFLSQATEFLTAVKGVNKTDVTTLLSRFKTLKAIINADVDSLSLCPGIGPVKARRLHNTFTTPFIKQGASTIKHLPTKHNTNLADGLDDSDDDS